MSRPRILCLSYDDTVSEYRRKALGEGGYDVITTTDPREASRLLGIEQLDLLVIGHRFSVCQKKDLILQAKKFGPIPVLLVCGASSDSELAVDGRVYALQGTEGLLAGIAKLVPLTTAV